MLQKSLTRTSIGVPYVSNNPITPPGKYWCSRTGASGESLDKIRSRIDSAYADLLREALYQTGGNKSKAADLLDISRKTFYRMLEKYILGR